MSKEAKITATQKESKLTPYQIDILESMDKTKSCDIIISISKTRPVKGEPITLKVDYNGKRLIPLNK